jgi:hypothetical protein
MKTRFAAVAFSLAALLLGSFLVSTRSASAHERRNVGAFTFVVGFLNEPPLLNQPNSIDLRISHTADGSPVTGAEKTLKGEVSFEDQKLPADLSPRFGTPGAYNAYFTPTKPGTYSFTFTGTLESTPVNEKFTSGPSTFGNVEPPKGFPVALPAVQDVQQQVQEQLITAGKSSSPSSSSGNADTALIIGVVGLVVGTAGLGLAGYSLTRKA